MKYFTIILMLCLVLFSVNAFAAGGSGSRSVQHIQTSDIWFAVYPDTPFDNPDGCEDTSKVVFWTEDFPQGHSQLLSIAMSALMSDKLASMWFSGCKLGVWGKTLPKAHTIKITK